MKLQETKQNYKEAQKLHETTYNYMKLPATTQNNI